jgi:homocitrate synthase NifV
LELALELDALGVEILEAGIPVMGAEEIECLQAIQSLGLKAQLLNWCRMRKEDIGCALETGIRNVHFAVPASPVHIQTKLGTTEEDVIYRMAECVEYAQNKGLTVSVGAEDASRAQIGFVIRLFREAEKLGVTRVRYADTTGILNPFSACEQIRYIREHIGADIDFHGHNDFGMATANALGAYKGGANVISCSVNGLGERAGNTPLEEIVLALEHREGCKLPIDHTRLQQVSELVERCSGKCVEPAKPIVGRDIFTHESGIHVDGLLKCRQTYEALRPEELGRTGRFVLGKFSGRRAVMHELEKAGARVDPETAGRILDQIRKKSYARKMTREDFWESALACLREKEQQNI